MTSLEWRLHPVAGYRLPRDLSHYDLWEQVVAALSAGVDPDALTLGSERAHAPVAVGRAGVLRGVRRRPRAGAARAGRDRRARATRPTPPASSTTSASATAWEHAKRHDVDRRDGVRRAEVRRPERHHPMTTTTDRAALAAPIYATSHITGEFVLRSGAVSNEYFDKYRFEADPALLRDIAAALVAARARRHRGARRASSSAASRSPPCCRSSPASRRSSCARRRRPTARASSPRAATIDGTRLTVVEDVVTSGGQVVLVVRRPARAGRDRRARAVRHRPRVGRPGRRSPTSASSSTRFHHDRAEGRRRGLTPRR